MATATRTPRYGVQIEKPPRWHFVAASTVIDLARKAAGMRPAMATIPSRRRGSAVIVSKAPVLGREVAPQVVLMVQDLPKAPRTWFEDVRAPAERDERSRDRDADRVLSALTAGQRRGSISRATSTGRSCARPPSAPSRTAAPSWVAGQALAAEFDGEAVTFDTILRSFRLR